MNQITEYILCKLEIHKKMKPNKAREWKETYVFMKSPYSKFTISCDLIS